MLQARVYQFASTQMVWQTAVGRPRMTEWPMSSGVALAGASATMGSDEAAAEQPVMTRGQ